MVRGRFTKPLVLFVVAFVPVGCASTVEGSARRHESPAAALIEILPTAEEVSAAVGNPLDAVGAPKIGSISVLPNGIRSSEDAAPLDCLGAATPLMRVVYESGGVQAAAWQDYARFGKGLTVSSAEAGVVRMDSAEAASRTFAAFVTKWQACDGTEVNMQGLELTVTRVRVNGPVLTAVILGGDGRGDEFPTEHAVGVADDCIVDADVAITDPDPTRRAPGTRAADIVRLMLERISA
ncbi:MAG: sensor domain-containing protein [Mycobacterium sp.]